MELMKNLLSDETGLMVAFTISFVIAMSVFFGKYFSKKMNDDAKLNK